jgi:hypothetical protein
LLLPLPKTVFKMLLSKTKLKCFNSLESSGINLPTEVWIHIWSFLDFEKCQEICTRVSKEWLYKIRNSTRLSGEIILKLNEQNIGDINDALSRWPKLKVLHLHDYNSSRVESRLSKLLSHWEKLKEFTLTTEFLGINLTEHALLRKIVVSGSMPLVELGDWGKATKLWFDPKNWTPANLSNVKNLTIYVDFFPKDVDMVQIGNVLMNVEELVITEKRGLGGGIKFDSEFILGLQNFILGFKKLTSVLIHVSVNITDFLDLLQSVASVKDLLVWLRVCTVHDHLEEKYVQGVFEEGFKIVEKEFPIESTDVDICDSGYNFRIDKKYYREPVFENSGQFLTVWVD